MTKVINTFTTFINAKPEDVFAYVSDLTRHGEWSGAPLTVEAVSNGPIAVGSQYRSRGDLPGQKGRPNELRVTQYQAPTRFSFVAQDPSFGGVTHDFTFQPQNNGTLMERTVTAQVNPLVAFAFRNFIFPMIGKPQMDKALAALKAKMESK